MDLLVAHGAEASRWRLVQALAGEGVEIREAAEGADALEMLLADNAPRIAVIDWDLPRIEGPELCRLVRDFHVKILPYVILLAAPAHQEEVTLGLIAGANDCVRTPVTSAELLARVEMGRRFVELPWGQASPGIDLPRGADEREHRPVELEAVLGRD